MQSNNCSFIGDTPYALLIYMLYTNDDMLKHTTYYIGPNLSSYNLEKKVVMPPIEPYTLKELIKYRLKCLKYRRILKKTPIFAQDHLPFSAPLLDNLPYILIEDSPNYFTVLTTRIPKEPPFEPSLGSYWQNFQVGRIYRRYGGYNPWCKKRLVTSASDADMFRKIKLPFQQISLDTLWNQASPWKKSYIKNVYSMPSTGILEERKIVLFSQPLIKDAHLSIEDFVAIYKPYIERYGAENILIKLHPRDDFDYKKYFPKVETLKTKAPQQLLSLMGAKFKIAITVSSSAVSSLNQDCKIIWLGTEIDPRIVQVYGHVSPPRFN